MILDCCRNKLDPRTFPLSDEQITDAQDATDLAKVIQIWATEENHQSCGRNGATFSEALCEVLDKNPKGVKTENLERFLNKHWREKQRKHLKKEELLTNVKWIFMEIMNPSFRALRPRYH